MKLELNLENPAVKKDNSRVKEAQKKKEDAKYVPSWEEVWIHGWTSHTGTAKTAILKTKITDSDRNKLMEVKHAVEMDLLGTGVEDLRKFTKSHALNLYKVLQESRREANIEKMLKNKPANYHLITEEEDFKQMLLLLRSEQKIAVDTETTGVEHTDHIVGISLSLQKADYHCYIPVRHNVEDKQLPADYVMENLKYPLGSLAIKKVLHNFKFDQHMLAKEGSVINGVHMDTMVAMHILNENEDSYALKKLSTKYGKHFGFDDKSSTYEELFGKGGFQDTPLEIGTIYACKDTHLTLAFSEWIEEHLKKQPQLYDMYFNIENKILEVSYEMEKNGFLVDLDFAKVYKEELSKKVQEMETKLAEWFEGINVASNVQLANYLYNDLELPDLNKGSVDADTLKNLKDEYEGIAVLLEYRELSKLLTTYIEPLPQKIWEDGRLHGQFNQAATVTGRFASRNPNLQNIPYDARKLIVAPKGMIMVGIDLSAIEPRILAHISKDKDMQRPFLTGVDMYSTLASKIFNKTYAECGDGTIYRKRSKVVLLATMYGISARSLGESLNMTADEAQKILDNFLDSYKNVRDFITKTQEKAFTEGYVEMLQGRKRRFHKDIQDYKEKITSDNWKIKQIAKRIKGRINRQSVNAVIQGSAAIVLKIGMIKLYELCKQKNFEFIATIHDENLIYVPEDTPEEDILELGKCMTNAVKLDVALKCDIEISRRWGEGVSLKEWFNKEG